MTRGALVLAGGRSSRMGTDKALLPVDDRLLILRVAMRMRVAADVAEMVVACGPAARVEPYRRALSAIRDVPIRVVPDEVEGLGPLAGLAAGMANATAEYVAVAPVDAPLLEPAVVERLLSAAEEERRDGAVVGREGRLEALWGVYRRRIAAGHFRYALARGVRAVHEALAGLDLAVVAGEEVGRMDPRGGHFLDLDEPSDVERFLRPQR